MSTETANLIIFCYLVFALVMKALGLIALIGVERKPVTRGEAILGVVVNSAWIYLIYRLWM